MSVCLLAIGFLLSGFGCSKNKVGSDESGAGSTDSAPIVRIVSPGTDEHFYVDSKVPLVVSAADDVDAADALEWVWLSDIQGELISEMSHQGDDEFTGTVRLDEGEHILRVEVSDSAGNKDADQVLVSVGPPNSPPSCEIVFPVTVKDFLQKLHFLPQVHINTKHLRYAPPVMPNLVVLLH